MFHFTSNTSELIFNDEIQEYGKITGGTTSGSGADMTGNVYITIRPSYDDFVIHENRHGNQILAGTDKRPVLEIEREAYIYQRIYNPMGIENMIEDAKKEQYSTPSSRPAYYSLDDAIKLIYKIK